MGAEVPGSTRGSKNTQPLGLQFRALLAEGGARQVELVRA